MVTHIKNYLDGGSIGIKGDFYYEENSESFDYEGELFLDKGYNSLYNGDLFIKNENESKVIEEKWIKEKLVEDLKDFGNYRVAKILNKHIK